MLEIGARDERSLLVRGIGNDGSTRFWWVPLDGREPRLLSELAGFKIHSSGFSDGFELHPAGRRIAFAIENPRTVGDQIFVLEDFLPEVKR
jgi:hypothetical protein